MEATVVVDGADVVVGVGVVVVIVVVVVVVVGKTTVVEVDSGRAVAFWTAVDDWSSPDVNGRVVMLRVPILEESSLSSNVISTTWWTVVTSGSVVIDISGLVALSFSSTALSEAAYVSSVRIAVVESSVDVIGAAELVGDGSGVSVTSSVVLLVVST